jgi:hypothetical protein
LAESLGNGIKTLGKGKVAKLFGGVSRLVQGLLQAQEGQGGAGEAVDEQDLHGRVRWVSPS